MLKRETVDAAARDVLTDEQLELASGGDDGSGNIPICPPWFPGRPGFPVGFPQVHGGAPAGKLS